MKRIFPIWLCYCMVWCDVAVYAEGSGSTQPAASDRLYLMTNNATYSSFGQYNGTDNDRLYIHIEDPGGEQIYFGFSRPTDNGGYPCAGALSTAYIRIIDPLGNVVLRTPGNNNGFLIDGTSSNITSWTQANNGPNQIVTTGGYTAFVFDPSSYTSGDYYMEFSAAIATQSATERYFEWWDITVADTGSSPVAIDGRVFSKNWALYAPYIDCGGSGPYSYFDRPFNGSFHVYAPTEGIVTKVDFNGAGFQPAAFNIAFNSTGAGTSGDPDADRASVEGANTTSPQYPVFINDPDSMVYPSGVLGQLLINALVPNLSGCSGDGYQFELGATEPGSISLLIDPNGNGSYDIGTSDRILTFLLDSLPGQSSPFVQKFFWDGLDGLGMPVDTTISVTTIITFGQGLFHLPVYDVEFNLNGFYPSVVRPTPNPLDTLFMAYDDRDITETLPGGQSDPELNGCLPPCHYWDNSNYGDQNTINTYWYSTKDIVSFSMAFDEPECDCGTLPNTISGTIFEDLDEDSLPGIAESGIPNIDVQLYNDVNTNGKIDGADLLVATATSDAQGKFAFTSVALINSYLLVMDLATFPLGYSLTTENLQSAVFGPGDSTDCNNNFGAKPGPEVNCYVVGDGTNDLFLVDRNTGVATLIGNLGVPLIEGIGFAANADTLYGADGGTFGIIDLMTGAFTAIGAFGSGNGTVGFKSFADVDGITYDAFEGILYGSVRTSGNDLIIRIDPQTGAHIPGVFNGDDYAVVSGTGILGDIDDIAIDPGTSKMYAISNTSGSGDVLIEIDKTSGNAVAIGAVGTNDMEGFGFANDGALYGTTGGNGSPANSFWSIDINTGAATLIANLPGTSSDYEACDCMVLPFEVPVLAIDDSATTSENVPVIVDVLANDYGPLLPSNIDTTGLLLPANGSVTAINFATGALTYTPDLAYLGFDSFEYVICDTLGSVCDTALVTIQIFGPEICNNLIDDNGNGLVDCDDNFCQPGQPGAITPSQPAVCENEQGIGYSIMSVAGATSYVWTVPPGANITNGSGTTSIVVEWGITSGSVCVEALISTCAGPQRCLSVDLDKELPKPGLIYFK